MTIAKVSLYCTLNVTLIKDIGKKDIGAFCCYSLIKINFTCNIKKKCMSVLHPVPSAF